MSAFIEVMVVGGGRAFLEASSIMGIITAPGQLGDGLASPEQPMSLILRGGEVLPGVYGISPNRLILNMAGEKMILRQKGRLSVVAYIDQQADLEAQIAEFLNNG